MSVSIRPAEMDREAVTLLSLLQRELSPLVDDSRLNWLYRSCPHGEAKVWVAAEENSGRLLGTAAVFPRRMTFGSGTENGFVFGDFCISTEHRSLGLAVRLQRRCLEEVERTGFVAGYDLPSNTMLAVYRRLGRQPSSKLVRLVKMLRTENWIATKMKSRTFAKVLSPAANTFLRMQRGSFQMKSDVRVEVQNQRFDEEYTELAHHIGAELGACVERTAEYLNWRYLDHPQHKYEVLTARQAGHLEGYLVLRREGGTVTIVDWFGKGPAELRKDLIRGLVAFLRPQGCERVQASILASHPYHDDLCALGFRPRESSPVMFFRTSEGLPSESTAHGSWLLMDGDRES